MTVVKFPSKLPGPQHLELPRAQLCGLLQELANDVLGHANELRQANNASELAAAVRKTAGKLAEASAGWAAMSNNIREFWGI
jgi:hypothetical protein